VVGAKIKYLKHFVKGKSEKGRKRQYRRIASSKSTYNYKYAKLKNIITFI
jgi:hypothetical protein